MTKETANIICEWWNKRQRSEKAEIRTIASVDTWGIFSEQFRVEIHPCDCNDGKSFHFIKALANISVIYDALSYIGVEDGKMYALLY